MCLRLSNSQQEPRSFRSLDPRCHSSNGIAPLQVTKRPHDHAEDLKQRILGIGEPAAGSRYGGRRGSPFLFLCFTQDGSDHLVVLSAVKCKTHGLRFFPPATLELIEHDVLLGLRHTAVAVTATVFATIAYCHNMDAVLPWRAMWGEVRQIVFNEPVRYPVPTVI